MFSFKILFLHQNGTPLTKQAKEANVYTLKNELLVMKS